MENYRRGMTVLETLYKDENEKIWATFGAHKDIRMFKPPILISGGVKIFYPLTHLVSIETLTPLLP